MLVISLGSSINDVTQFWTIFDLSSPIVTRFITIAFVLSSQNSPPGPSPYDRDVIYGQPRKLERRNNSSSSVLTIIRKGSRGRYKTHLVLLLLLLMLWLLRIRSH